MPAPAPLTPRRWATRFLLAAAAVALIVIGIGWFTDLRDSAHAALVSVLAFAFFPFVFLAIMAALVSLAIHAMIIGLLVGELPDIAPALDLAETSANQFTPTAFIYYTYLSKQRHPAFWGLPAGTLLGGLVLWSIVALVILPGETRTLTALVTAQSLVESAYDQSKSYPDPDASGQLTYESITARGVPSSSTNPPTGPILDGFGRPLLYTLEGKGRIAAYTIRSTGFDRSSPNDDLTLRGQTRLKALANAKSALGNLIQNLRGDKPTTDRLKLRALRDLRRDEP